MQALRAALSMAPTNADVAAQLHDAVQQQQVADLFRQGQQFYQSQNYRAALDCFREVRVLGGNYNDVDRLIGLVQESMKPPKKRKKWRWIVGGAVAVLFIIGIIESAVEDQHRRESAAAPPPETTTTDTTTQAASATPPPEQQPTPPPEQVQPQSTAPAETTDANSANTTSPPAEAPFNPTGDWTVKKLVNGQAMVMSYLSLKADGTYQLANARGVNVSAGSWTYIPETQTLSFVGNNVYGGQTPWTMRVVGAGNDYIDVLDPGLGPMRMFRD